MSDAITIGHIPLPPVKRRKAKKPKPPPMRQGTRSDVEDALSHIEHITSQFQNDALLYAREVGSALLQLKDDSHSAGMKWSEVCERLPFGQSMANRFMRIASNQALRKSEHVPNLPADTATLYTISRLPAPEVEQHIESGRINPKLSRADAAQLVKGDKPKPAPKKTPPPPADGQPQSRGDGLRVPQSDKPKSKGQGVQIAHEAIAVLKRIPVNDGLRQDALDIVVGWIDANTDGEVQGSAGNGDQGLLEAFSKAHPNARRELVRQNADWFQKAIKEVVG